MTWTRVLLAIASWVALWPLLAASAQEAVAPGTPGAQTVAHGVMAMPSEMMVWQSELQRAVVAPRAGAMPQPGGFVLADTGDLAITDADGKPLQRLSPGEATWIDPGANRAIVSLEGRSAGFLRISLIPASFVPDDPGATSNGEPFAAPTGIADLDLLRGVLARSEELAVSSGESPALLQVTSGKVFVTDENGEVRAVSAGSPLQFQGHLALSGGSRGPAAFVIARLGPSLPARLALLDPNATPAASPTARPGATPVSLTATAALSVEAWICPPGYDASTPATACTAPAAGVRFTVDPAGDSVNSLVDAEGTAVFPPLPPGTATLRAILPEGATTAVATCRNVRGDALGRVRNSALTLPLAPGSTVRCSWLVSPGEVWPAATLSVAVLACPPGMVADALHPEFCLPPETDIDVRLSLEGVVLEPTQVSEGLWVWGPLLERAYRLALPGLKPAYSGAVLDDGTRGGASDSFPLDLGGDLQSVRTVYLLRPIGVDAAEIDSDADRLTDAQELDIGTDPFLADSDGDGLADGDETDFYGTDPLAADTDNDGLDDLEEVAVIFTNPFLADTDGDGAGDAAEVAARTNPLDLLSVPPTPTPLPTATSSPGPLGTSTPQASPVASVASPITPGTATPEDAAMGTPAALPTLPPGASPIAYKATPARTPNRASAVTALDNDGLATLDEIAIYGTDPVMADTDLDGTNDGDEVASGRDPLDPAN
ncbi:MAG: hypothetical protein R2853_11740 [Thermomicrobiales bacterium]